MVDDNTYDELFDAIKPADDTGKDTLTNESNLFTDPGNGAYRFGMSGDKTHADITDPTSSTSTALDANGKHARENLNQGSLNKAKSGELFDENMQYGANIPIDSPFADYNNLSWEDTQRLSRLADAYNNRHRLQPGKTGTDAASRSMGQFVKNDPIETEEMRRMGMTRQGLSQQQSMALGRANDILAYPQKLNEMFDKAGLDADTAAMEINRNFADYANRAQFDEQFRAEFQNALQKDLLYWTQEMSQYQNGKVAQILFNEMSTNPQYAQWVASNLTNSVLPSQQQYLANLITNQIMRSSFKQGMSYEDVYTAVEQMFGRVTGVQAYVSQQQDQYAAKAAYGGGMNGMFTRGYSMNDGRR